MVKDFWRLVFMGSPPVASHRQAAWAAARDCVLKLSEQRMIACAVTNVEGM